MSRHKTRRPWWKAEDLAQSVYDHLRALSASQWRRTRERSRALSMWTFERDKYRFSSTGSGSEVSSSGEWADDYWDGGTRPSLNVSRTLAETVSTRLFREIPAARVIARGGSFETSLAAEAMSDALASSTNTAGAQQTMRDIGQSGIVTGFVAAMPRVTDVGTQYLEVPFERLYWDPREARNSKSPRSLHFLEYLDREVLLAQIDASPIPDEQKANLTETVRVAEVLRERFSEASLATPYERELRETGLGAVPSDVLIVCHSWHLPGRQGGDDGMYASVLLAESGRHLIERRPWTRTTFPITWFSPYRNVSGGIDGMGVMDVVSTHQRIIDRYAAREDAHLDIAGNTKVLTDGDDRAVELDFAADGVTFVTVPMGAAAGTKPYEIVPGNPQSLQALAWLDNIKQAAFEAVGVNQMMSQGMSQRGAGASGVAMMEEEDRQGDRLGDVESRWDRFLARLAEETLNALDDKLEYEPDFAITYQGPMGDESANWEDLRSPTRDHHLEVELSGQRARNRAGRIARIFEMVDRGAFDQATSLAEVMGSANIEKLSRWQQAGLHLVEWQLAGLSIERKNPNDYAPFWPTAETPFAMAKELAVVTIRIATTRMAKTETIGRLREYVLLCDRMLQRQTPPPSPPGPPGLPGPGGPAAIPPEALAAMAGGLPAR